MTDKPAVRAAISKIARRQLRELSNERAAAALAAIPSDVLGEIEVSPTISWVALKSHVALFHATDHALPEDTDFRKFWTDVTLNAYERPILRSAWDRYEPHENCQASQHR